MQTWKTFLRNHMEGIASIDLFVVPTIAFQQLFALLVLRHERRQLLWFAVTRNPTAEWLARQITEAFPWDGAPKYLIRDNDRAFGVAFKARVRAMGIRDRPTSLRSPRQNGYVERLIGSIRRECTDHLIVLSEEHLRRILVRYATYYNGSRIHRSLNKDAPFSRAIEHLGVITSLPSGRCPLLGPDFHQLDLVLDAPPANLRRLGAHSDDVARPPAGAQ
ncbi:MAG TPA: integrase core domain-containing protein [Pseudolabrys sp.]